MRVDLEGARGNLSAPVSSRPALSAFTFPTTLPATPGDVPSRQVPTFPPRGREGGRALRYWSRCGRRRKGRERAHSAGGPRRRRGAGTPRAREPVAPYPDFFGLAPSTHRDTGPTAGARREGEGEDARSPTPVTCEAHTPQKQPPSPAFPSSFRSPWPRPRSS